MAQLPWDLYRSLLAVLRQGSLSAAARDLDLTQPTLGRHIAEIEEALGVSLFVRSQSGLAPTEAALLLRPHAEAMEVAAAALARTASGGADEPRGVVRVTASEMIGVEVMPPILARFREAHPGIVVELALSNLNQDLSRRDADIAVRMARPTQSALVAKKLGNVGISLYAHTSYLTRAGTPHSADDLARHTLIGFDVDPWSLRYFRQSGLSVSRDIFALRSDSEHAQLAALRAGFGIGGCQNGIARRDPNLVPILPGVFRFSLEMWLVMHENLRASRRVRLLYDHLAEHLRAYAAASLKPRAHPHASDAVARRQSRSGRVEKPPKTRLKRRQKQG
jgi:DNA-binding transcriptional LysR family regulator